MVAQWVYLQLQNYIHQQLIKLLSHLEVEIVEVVDRIGGGKGRNRNRHLLLTLPQQFAGGKTLSHVLQPLNEPLFLAMCSKMRILERNSRLISLHPCTIISPDKQDLHIYKNCIVTFFF